MFLSLEVKALIFKWESSSIPFPSDRRSGAVQALTVRWKVLLNSHLAVPSHCVSVKFALHHMHLLSFPEASHWLLDSLLKIRLLEISTFCGEGLKKNTESSSCISPQQVLERGAVSLCFSVSERESMSDC